MLKILPGWLWVILIVVLAIVGLASGDIGPVFLYVILPSIGLTVAANAFARWREDK